MNHNLWKVLPETQDFIKAIDKEIQGVTEEITGFGLILKPTDQVMREYLGNVGVLEGLRRVKAYIEEIPDEQQSAPISWENEG